MKTKRTIVPLATLTIILLLVFQIGCKKDIVEDENTPIVTTASINNVTHNSATGGGNVTDQGSSTVYARGVCWDSTENPTTADSLTISGEGPGSYSSTLSNLLPNTKYYLRAYATNKQGTSYGDQDTFVTLQNPAPVFDSVVVEHKQVLLEDFTGHKCVNCPEASISAHNLAEELDHKLIIYSIHAGYYAEPDPTGNYTTDFQCDAGNEIFNSFSVVITSWPAGTVNRVEFEGNIILGDNVWEDAVYSELAKPNVINMTLKNHYDPEENKLTTEVLATFLQQLEGKYKLVVLLAEDHILSWQKNNDSIGPIPDWENYDHRNVLRDAISSPQGNYFTQDGTITLEETYKIPFNYYPSDDWVKENCHIIAYIIHEESGEILQVADLGIMLE